jgi:hypothetical protein
MDRDKLVELAVRDMAAPSWGTAAAHRVFHLKLRVSCNVPYGDYGFFSHGMSGFRRVHAGARRMLANVDWGPKRD